MKTLLLLSFLSVSVGVAHAAPVPVKYSNQVPCQLQGLNAMVTDALAKYGRTNSVLTSGNGLSLYAVLESWPVQNLYAGVLALKNKSSGAKSETYYHVRAGSVGLAAPEDEQPVYRCRVAVEEVSQAAYEAMISRE
ncbi:MAG TPA: hypothetical protein VNJ01_05880 [Bacteriovoracaceae bacterium]|nr:hypothetical protein [Bacteriovoracaceae bacterium]